MLALRRDSSPELSNGVLVLTGYGLRVAVERGHLIVEDGVGSARGLHASLALTEISNG
jgi:hypothetical protein